MQRRSYLAAASAVGVASVAGCTTVGDVGRSLLGETPYDIGMSRNAFEPESSPTTVGKPVVWKNTSGATHTVTAYEGSIPDGANYFASGGFESEDVARAAYWDDFGGGLDSGETYEHVFEVPGTYFYFCIPHEHDGRGDGRMTGEISVASRSPSSSEDRNRVSSSPLE